MTREPNFIYIGTSKAGSTWLFDLLSRHPDVFVTPTKGLYFFDHHFDKGWEWYLDHFSDAAAGQIVGEISHSYLYSDVACDRIAEMNPEIKLLVCLREPMDRAFSMYLDGIRNGKWTGSFEERCDDTREILEEGFYTEHLRRYLDRFPREQIHVSLFDDLKQTPEIYAQQVFEALGVSAIPFDPRLKKKVMPASVARNRVLVRLSKKLSQAFKKLGWKKIRGRIKRSRLIRNVLYRNVDGSQRATLSDQARLALRERFQPEVEQLEKLLDIELCQRWGYSTPTTDDQSRLETVSAK